MNLTRSISRWSRGSAGRLLLPLIAVILTASLAAPASAAHGRRSVHRISFCDIDGCSIRGRHHHSSHRHHVSEYDRGARLGARDGGQDGLADGRCGHVYCGVPHRDLYRSSSDFARGYRAAYRSSYREAYRESSRTGDYRHRHHRRSRRW